MKRKFFIPIIVIIVLAAAWFWWKSAPAAEEAAPPPVASVEVTPLKRESIAQTLDVFGVVAPAASGEQVIVAPYECAVRAVHVSPGAVVRAGEVLVELAPSPDARLLFDSARATAALAARALAAVQERYNLKLAPLAELLAARQANDDARLKLRSLRARGLGGDGRITAPVAGIVTRLDLPAGGLIAAGTPLLGISARASLEARLGVEAEQSALVRPGQAVTLVSATRPGAAPAQSAVRAVGAAVDPSTGAVTVFVPLPDGGAWLLGEHVRAAVTVARHEGLVVPRSAVLPAGGHWTLFTVKDGKAVEHEVRLGFTTDATVEVIGGHLAPGEPVVTLGNYELSDGMAVQTGAAQP